MNTFSEEDLLAVYIGELIETGVVCTLGGFGWSGEEYLSFPELPIHEDFPICIAIRTRSIVIDQNDQDFEKRNPVPSSLLLTHKWESILSIPVYPIGGMALLSKSEIKVTETSKLFYIAIGSLLGLYASRVPVSLVEVAIDVKKKVDLPQVPLSDRQLVIADMLERGFNNAQIGLELGYSESLIRQETVAIYRKLQVTGRKAMQAISALNLQAQDLIDKQSEELTKI
jgi:DNA-binding CsgD family transcriptional regulator